VNEGLAAAVRALAAVLRSGGDDGELAVVRDPDALAQLQRAFRLPAAYAEFLRAHSSHGFVDAGLVCDGAPVWLTPVDTVAEIHACFPELPRGWLVCAIADEGCYALALERSRGDDCPVMFVRDGAREVAPGFVAFLRRIAGDTAAARRSAPRIPAPVSRVRLAWLAAAVFAAAMVVGFGLR
jgi:hypothetical protein